MSSTKEMKEQNLSRHALVNWVNKLLKVISPINPLDRPIQGGTVRLRSRLLPSIRRSPSWEYSNETGELGCSEGVRVH